MLSSVEPNVDTIVRLRFTYMSQYLLFQSKSARNVHALVYQAVG